MLPIWYLSEDQRLPLRIFKLIESAADNGETVFVSAISLIEVVYLIERGRIVPETYDRLAREVRRKNASWLIANVDPAVAELLPRVPRKAVPDMPDRIIAATAIHLGLPLVTADRRIRAAGLPTI